MRYCCVWTSYFLMAFAAGPLAAQSVFALPTFSQSFIENAAVFSGSPLVQVATPAVPVDVFKVLVRPAPQASGTKYYLLARQSSIVMVLDSTFQPLPAIFTGQALVDGVLTPDGNRLYLVSGSNLRVYDTATDQPVAIPQAINLFSPESMAVSPDSKYIYVHSSQGQSVQTVDTASNVLLGPENRVNLSLTTQTAITIGPDGLLYISAEDKVLVYNTHLPLGPAAFIRQIALPSGSGFSKTRAGRLHFTPDGRNAIAVNRTPASGHSLLYFQLDPAQTRVAPLPSIGDVFDQIAVTSNSRAWVTTAATSTNPRRLFRADLPAGVDINGVLPFPTLQEVGIAAKGLAESGEYPEAQRLYVDSPGPPFRVYEMNPSSGSFPSNPTVAFLPSLVAQARPAATPFAGSIPSAVLRYGAYLSGLTGGSRSVPFGIRVLDAGGRPIYNQAVTFAVSGPATLNGPNVAVTNDTGFAMNSITMGATPGTVTVTATVSGTGLSSSFVFGAGGGGTGTTHFEVLEGEGVVIREGDFSDARFRSTAPGFGRTRVRVVDGNNQPVSGATVTWDVVSGGGRWFGGTPDTGNGLNTVTGSDGIASNIFVAPGTGTVGQNAFRQVLARVTTGAATADLHYVAIPIISDNTLTPYPLTTFLAPTEDPLAITGASGSVLTGAIRVRFSSAGSGFGQAMPNVGLQIDAAGTNPGTGPSAVCDPAPVVLSGADGIATCNLRLLGQPGTAQVKVRLGGYSERILNLTVTSALPDSVRIVSGNNQSGQPGARASSPLVVEAVDGNGGALPGRSIHWEVIQGSATLDGADTATDGQGRASNGLQFGLAAGTVRVRATLTGTAASVTFDLTSAAKPRVLSVTPSSGAGAIGTFVVDFEDPDGAGDLAVLNVLINDGIDGRQSCYLAYVPSGLTSGTVLLVNDTGDAGGPFAGSVQIPGTATAQNGRCAISAAGSQVLAVGNRLTLVLSVSFTGAHAGRRIVYTAARDRNGNNSGWVAKGVWTVTGGAVGATRVESLAPARSTSSSGIFTVVFADNDGGADLSILNLLINSGIDGRGGCYLAVVRASSTVLLVNDAGDAGGPFAGTLTAPGSGSIANSQCRVDAAGSSVATFGGQVTVTLQMTFFGGFAGDRIVYAAARDQVGNSSGWQAAGTITIP
ncbi:MAG: hypothetical protein R2729_32635 [Bryobacteraceae bacterium]